MTIVWVCVFVVTPQHASCTIEYILQIYHKCDDRILFNCSSWLSRPCVLYSISSRKLRKLCSLHTTSDESQSSTYHEQPTTFYKSSIAVDLSHCPSHIMTCAGGKILGSNTLIATNIKVWEEHKRHVLEAHMWHVLYLWNGVEKFTNTTLK